MANRKLELLEDLGVSIQPGNPQCIATLAHAQTAARQFAGREAIRRPSERQKRAGSFWLVFSPAAAELAFVLGL